MPEPTTSSIMTYLVTQGVLGVACLILGLVVWKLYNKTERLEKEKSDLMELRRVDALEAFNKIVEVVENNSQTNRLLTEKIELGKEVSSRGRR